MRVRAGSSEPAPDSPKEEPVTQQHIDLTDPRQSTGAALGDLSRAINLNPRDPDRAARIEAAAVNMLAADSFSNQTRWECPCGAVGRWTSSVFTLLNGREQHELYRCPEKPDVSPGTVTRAGRTLAEPIDLRRHRKGAAA